jgi:glyceraldehyde-3-phosphate dehydrogenase (NAD(P))
MSTTNRSTPRTRVGVVGYGVVGKRVADGVALQPDMELVGIADVAPTSLVAVSVDRGFPLFAADPSALPGFQAAGLAVAGDLDDLIRECDVIVDCSPPGIPEKNLARCRELGTKFICEGGEDHALTGFSFSSFANYEAAAGRDAARVVSCNTTSECRILSTLDRAFSIDDAFLAITRRGADPANIKSGPINATIPVLPGFSHHAPDIITVIPGLNVKSMAVIASTTLMHVHILRVEVARSVTKDEVVELLASTPRVRMVSGESGDSSTAHLIEWARDQHRPRGDHWEVAVWEDSIAVDGQVIFLTVGVHMESVIAPENVDCIRAMSTDAMTASQAIYRTDEAFGFARDRDLYAVFDR